MRATRSPSQLLLVVQAKQEEAGVADAEVVNSNPEATGWELSPGLSAGKAHTWPSTGAGHLGQTSLHDTSHLVLLAVFSGGSWTPSG